MQTVQRPHVRRCGGGARAQLTHRSDGSAIEPSKNDLRLYTSNQEVCKITSSDLVALVVFARVTKNERFPGNAVGMAMTHLHKIAVVALIWGDDNTISLNSARTRQCAGQRPGRELYVGCGRLGRRSSAGVAPCVEFRGSRLQLRCLNSLNSLVNTTKQLFKLFALFKLRVRRRD